MPMYKMDEDTQIDEFGVDHSNFSLRDEIEYNYHRAKEKEMQNKSTSYYRNSPWQWRAFDNVVSEGLKLKNEPLNDKYKHAVVSCTGGQDGLYGSGITYGMGAIKEAQDMYRKFSRQRNGRQDYGGYTNILFDSAKDMKANLTGIGVGYTNPTGDCYDMMKYFYNPKQGY